MQPLRHAALQRRQLLPLRRLIPPRGKDSFIKGLQLFFKAGEVEFVNVSQEAISQLMAFPTGRKDFPNALAYALHMRPGLPVYDGFSRDHVAVEHPRLRCPWWLVVNATPQYTTAVLLQTDVGAIRVAADWVREGPPGDHLQNVVSEARLQVATSGQLNREPVDNAYKVLMEGLESFVAGMQAGQADEDDGRRTAVAPDGRVYTTIRATPQ